MATTLASPELSITTVRTLAMDAVQKANSGHPGAPMGLAPVGWTLFTQAPPPRPLRPGLAGPRPLRAVGRARVDAALRASAPDRLRPARWTSSSASASSAPRPPATPSEATPRGSRSPPGRSARGSPTPWASPSPSAMLAARFNRPDGEIVGPPHVVHLLRRRHDGGHLPRGRLDRRLPRPRAAHRDLRRQPHQPRRADEPLVRRGRHRDALRGLRLARPARGGRQRPRGDRRGADRGRPSRTAGRR